jgi:hypothetical protein
VIGFNNFGIEEELYDNLLIKLFNDAIAWIEVMDETYLKGGACHETHGAVRESKNTHLSLVQRVL